MKLKIEHRFLDKNTKQIYTPGEVIEFTDGRAAEILADVRKLASVADDAQAEETPAETAEKPAKKRATKKPAKTKK